MYVEVFSITFGYGLIGGGLSLDLLGLFGLFDFSVFKWTTGFSVAFFVLFGYGDCVDLNFFSSNFFPSCFSSCNLCFSNISYRYSKLSCIAFRFFLSFSAWFAKVVLLPLFIYSKSLFEVFCFLSVNYFFCFLLYLSRCLVRDLVDETLVFCFLRSVLCL